MDLLQRQIIDSYGWACMYASRCTSSFPGCYDREELTSAGIVGYVMAAHRYDESKGSSFRSFCATRIRGAIMDELRRLTWEPRSVRRNLQTLIKKRAELEAGLQRKPTNGEMADSLGIEEEDLVKIQQLSQPPSFVSLDDDTSGWDDEEHLPLREIIADQSVAPPSKGVDMVEIRRALCSGLSKLPRIEASIIINYYMRNISFNDIAKAMKLTPSRICQLHQHALASLKKNMAID